jgi:type IV pilus assembly protein PilY1
MNSYRIHSAASAFLLGVILSAVLAPAVAAVTPANIPLNVGVSAAKPNIMLMLDSSGSMDDPVVTNVGTISPSDMPSTFSYRCKGGVNGGVNPPGTPAAPVAMTVNSTGAPRFCKDSSTCSSRNQTAFSRDKCFKNDQNYNVAYFGGATLAGGPYTGLQLNWYFSTGSFTQGSLTASSTITNKRIDIAKQAATDLVDSLTPDAGERAGVRLGFSRYNPNNDGGLLLSEIKDLDDTHATAIKSQINAITPNGATPLAETLSDIGKYFATFATGETGNLKLHPESASPTLASVDTVFSRADGTVRSIKNGTCGTATCTNTLAAPILGYCQKSFAVLVSDGLPTQDDQISTSLKNYLNGNEYLDDVAKALNEVDLRPALDPAKKTETASKNNLVTYTIGLADPALNNSTSVLNNAAVVGGGKFFFADDSKALAAALENTIADISSKISSSASVVANSTKLDANSAIFQGKFDSADWTGSLSMFPLGVSEDANGNGKLDLGEDTNSNGKLDGGAVGEAIWNAVEHIPAFADRNILTYKPGGTPRGVAFNCTNLTDAQKTALGIALSASCTSTTDQGLWRLNYIRGDWSHEERNPTRKDPDTTRPDPITQPGVGIFRNRTHLSKDGAQIKVGPDPWLLGDIVNSNPVYVSNENYGYSKLPAADGGSTYKTFVTNNASRRKMVYVGANDGMFHGFDANASGTDAGKELLAYIPNAVYERLDPLSSPDYNHFYSVDGAPRVADAFFGNAWHTLLVSTTGAGAKAVFALDITNPTSFGGSNVLWEISNTDSPKASDLTSDPTTLAPTALRGFANNLGYTLPQASIVKMNNGSWAAIVANGYGSNNELAVLYIIDVQTGEIISAIDTKAGGVTSSNGLSTPIAVDMNNDRLVDVIYAGDLRGNMWKFDVTSTTPSAWKVAYGTASSPAPLFVACSNASACDTTRQPITGKPQVGGVSKVQAADSAGSIMVYFGTGKYFEAIDNNVSGAQTQTFYGIWDRNATVSRGNLQVQSITNEVKPGDISFRITTNTAVNYPTQKGWYMDLLKPSTTTSDGERVVSFPLLRDGRIIFTTLIPIPPSGTAICGQASEGTSWLMELEALTGSRLPDTGAAAPWDITGDGIIDDDDLVLLDSFEYSPSGMQTDVGAAGTPGVVTDGKREFKYLSGSKNAEIGKITESRNPGAATGSRQSWRQIQQ